MANKNLDQLLEDVKDEVLADVFGGASNSDIKDIWWDEMLQLKNMPDQHLKNAALKLMGFSTSEYEGSEDAKTTWLKILVAEWNRRQVDRRAISGK